MRRYASTSAEATISKNWRLKSLQSAVSLPNVTKGIPKENLFYPNFSPSVLFKCSLQINTLKAWWIQLYGSILIFLLFRFFPLSLYSVEFEIRLQSKMLTLIITDCKRKKKCDKRILLTTLQKTNEHIHRKRFLRMGN